MISNLGILIPNWKYYFSIFIFIKIIKKKVKFFFYHNFKMAKDSNKDYDTNKKAGTKKRR